MYRIHIPKQIDISRGEWLEKYGRPSHFGWISYHVLNRIHLKLSGCGRSGRRRCNWRGERYCRWMLVVKDTYEDIKYWLVDRKIWWAGHHHVSVVNPSWYWRCKMWYVPFFLEEGLLLKVNHARKVKRFISKKVWLRSFCWMYVVLIQSYPISLVYLLYKLRNTLELQLQIGFLRSVTL